jgi:hypothetical protein
VGHEFKLPGWALGLSGKADCDLIKRRPWPILGRTRRPPDVNKAGNALMRRQAEGIEHAAVVGVLFGDQVCPVTERGVSGNVSPLDLLRSAVSFNHDFYVLNLRRAVRIFDLKNQQVRTNKISRGSIDGNIRRHLQCQALLVICGARGCLFYNNLTMRGRLAKPYRGEWTRRAVRLQI